MSRYLISAQAEKDLEDHALYIGRDRPSSAREFIDAAIAELFKD